jgi:allophanate hydrolase subunit 2
VRVAVSGATRAVEIAGSPLLLNETGLIAEGETLKLGAARDGMFSYLAIEGGIAGEPMFGSLSVNARADLGSPFPRPLQDGDALDVGTAQVAPHERALDTFGAPQTPIRVVMGPQDDEFGAACDVFLNSEWRISATSDRMGYRLEGPKVVHPGGHNIVSDGAVHGSIQVPGNGQPIVLMADRHDRRLSQDRDGDQRRSRPVRADAAGAMIRFKAVSVEDAQTEARKLAAFIRDLPGRIHAAGGSSLNLVELQKANVAGVAVNAVDTATWQTQNAGEPQ